MTKKLTQGYTLVETLVAIFILIMGVTGAFTAVYQGLSSSVMSRDQVVAYYLAEEGIEMVRNTRDSNALQGLNWLHGMAEMVDDPCAFGRSCYKDVFGATFISCTGIGACPVLNQDATTGFYRYGSYPSSIYNREITLNQTLTNFGQEVAVTVIIRWSKGTAQRQFRVRENLFNWPTP